MRVCMRVCVCVWMAHSKGLKKSSLVECKVSHMLQMIGHGQLPEDQKAWLYLYSSVRMAS